MSHLLIASGLLVVITLGGSLRADPVSALVYSVSGTADFALPQSLSYNPLKSGQTVPVGSTIRTGDDGKVVLQTTPGSSVEIGNDSILKITELAFQKSGGAVTQRKANLELTSGVVSALVDPSTPKVTDFKIQTPDGALVARGTKLTVVVRNGKTYSSTGEGKVSAIANPSRNSI